MIRNHGGAIALGLSLLVLLGGSVARAQETTGRVVGRVVDKDTGAPLAGVTVIVQGPQGEDATITDGRGDYYFSTLPTGTYVIRFYAANSPTHTEQPGVSVSPDKTLRVNARIAGQAAAAAQETYVITRKPPAVDIGSTRLGASYDSTFNNNIPVGRTFGELIEKAPGAFVDRTGSVSIGGATGLENIYVVDGINVTGMEYGNINNNTPSLGGGSNFPVDFIDQVQVNSGGYSAEFGGAMGGVISVVTKSGGNELRGSAFSYWSPYFMAGQPRRVTRLGNSISTLRKPDFDTTIGAEVSGPIIKNKLFFWVGFAPRYEKTHVFRYTNTLLEDTDGSTQFGREVGRLRLDEPRQTHHYGVKLDFLPAPDHRLTVSLFGSPSSGEGMRAFSGLEAISDPAWARESIDRNTTDMSLRWVSKIFDRRWQIEALAGVHMERFDNKSPDAALNQQNQLEWWTTNLYDREGIAGCMPTAAIPNPCPVDVYHNGGFGQVKKYSADRWVGELKSTHLFEAGGHHEVKYGWHLEYNLYDQNRYYSGAPGSRALLQHYPGSTSAWTFFSLQPGERVDEFYSHPWDLATGDHYQDNLRAKVKSFNQAFFLQDSYSIMPNLTLNAGVRYEMQKMYDFRGTGFLDLSNLAPRLGLIYDPSKDGRSKIFAHWGQYYEAIPMNLAARYFGGEGILIRQNIDRMAGDCDTNPIRCEPGRTEPGNYFVANAGVLVQPNLKGQYHNEIVVGGHHEVMEDLVAGIDYTHRWLGAIVEDASAGGAPVLSNPGDVSQAALDEYQRRVDAATDDAARATAQADLDHARALGAMPKPERTYDAVTLSVNKRFSRNWLARASYTYSRVFGNYEGLYQDHLDYAAPNGSAAYDAPDLLLNQRGPLPNDRPHSARFDGYHTQPVGKGSIVFGLSFSARSGQPTNYVSNLLGVGQYTNLLPRGSGDRTPTVTQFDAKLSYRRPLTAKAGLEAFIDLFNIFNQQATLRVDQDYTFDSSAPIVGGTKEDLKFAKNTATGGPVTPNPNFGRSIAFQAPFHARLGLRLTF